MQQASCSHLKRDSLEVLGDALGGKVNPNAITTRVPKEGKCEKCETLLSISIQIIALQDVHSDDLGLGFT